MKHKTIEIFLFIDALGWKIVNDHKFLTELLPERKKINMQFGYSSSAIPTILSGKTPSEHGHLGLFRFAP
ncbi:MAG: nucleotide pyrophosphatase, partial [Lentisphaeria bacterium]|nr:nucleotide pyrophosphatase [Lentisphaeria bacterium]